MEKYLWIGFIGAVLALLFAVIQRNKVMSYSEGSPEMQKIAGLDYPPAFLPVLGDVYKGMCTTVMLHNTHLGKHLEAEEIYDLLAFHYSGGPVVKTAPFGEAPARLYTSQMAGTDGLLLTATGHQDQTLITAQFDNLGKGASGAAVQNMNLMLGFEETAGLNLA